MCDSVISTEFQLIFAHGTVSLILRPGNADLLRQASASCDDDLLNFIKGNLIPLLGPLDEVVEFEEDDFPVLEGLTRVS